MDSEKDDGNFLENQVEEIRVTHETGQTRNMYHLIRSFDKKSKNLPGTILIKEENPVTATAETFNQWAELLKELLNRPLVKPVRPRHSTEQPLALVGITQATFVAVKEQCVD